MSTAGQTAAEAPRAPRALVTGAAHGLGRALARGIIATGGTVVGVDRDLLGLEELGGDTVAVVADLSETASLGALGARLAEEGPYRLVVMNAGVNATGRFEDVPVATQTDVIAVNLTAPMVLTASLIAADAIAPGGTLIFVSSLSRFLGYPGAACYAASKDGLASFARGLRRPLVRRGVNVLTAYPGPLDTAHAARHAPPGAGAGRRLAPEAAARIILQAARHGGVVVPGAAAKAAALLGWVFPGAATTIMRRTVFGPLVGK